MIYLATSKFGRIFLYKEVLGSMYWIAYSNGSRQQIEKGYITLEELKLKTVTHVVSKRAALKILPGNKIYRFLCM